MIARTPLVPAINYPVELPVSERASEIAAAIREHQVIIVCGETGSGKSTQLPKICLEAGRGLRGMIGHTQPRRLAARAIAARLADEMKTTVGDRVGYTVRFNDVTSPETLVKVMTDGILLAEIPSDRDLWTYDTLIIDEAHERSLNIDFLLGYLRTLQPRRPDMRIVITSATIDPQRFSEHFGDAPIIEVSGRTYPVEVRYRPVGSAQGGDSAANDETGSRRTSGILGGGGRTKDGRGGGGGGGGPSGSSANRSGGSGGGGGRGPRGRAPGGSSRGGSSRRVPDGIDPTQWEQPIVDAVRELLPSRDAGDILVFLPGEREIRDAARALRRELQPSGDGRGPHGALDILPLYARLSGEEQQRIFRPGGKRRIVLSTNVAETSITVPGIRSVVDTGLARISRYGARTKVQQLPIEAISQASANQRSGRCGRVAPGICIRLYAEDDFELRDAFTAPEIQRTNLAGVILRMKAMRLGDPLAFPFVEPPRRAAVRDGYDTLVELGALDHREELTDLGRRLARLPVDPRIGRMLLAGLDEACFTEVAILAAALSVQDPRERPVEKREAADQAHAAFRHESSDFLTFLNLWDAWTTERAARSSSAHRRWCIASFLNWTRMREWQDLHRQLIDVTPGGAAAIRGERGRIQSGRGRDDAAVHRAVLTGLLSNVAIRDEQTPSSYKGARGGVLRIHPSSTLKRQAPDWIMAGEVVETTDRWARIVAGVKPEDVERAGAHLVKRSHRDPRWDRETGRVVCLERLTLFGQELGRGRTVDFGTVDGRAARELFIHHALVEREFDCREPFFVHNGRVIESINELERRQRRHDVMVETGLQFAFYEDRIPADVFDAASLHAWLEGGEARRGDPGSRPARAAARQQRLRMSVDDLVAPEARTSGDEQGESDAGSGRSGGGTSLADAAGGAGLELAGGAASSGPAPRPTPAPDVPASSPAESGAPTTSPATSPAASPSDTPAPAERRKRRGGSKRARTAAASARDLRAAAGLLGLDPDDFPDTLRVGDNDLPLRYRNDPGADDDGVTLTVPVGLVGQLSIDRLEWLVPGRLAEKVLGLIRTLPGAQRRMFVPAAEVASTVASGLTFGAGSLRQALADALTERSIDPDRPADVEPVRPGDFDPGRLEPDLHMRIRVVDGRGKTLGAGRDLERLRAAHVGRARDALAGAGDARWRRDGITEWDVGELPAVVDIHVGGLPVRGFPALVDRGTSVSLRIVESEGAAARLHHLGLRRLLLLACRAELAAQLDWVPDIDTMRLRYRGIAAVAGRSAPPFDEAFMLLTCELAFLAGRPAPRTRKAFAGLLDAGWSSLRERSADVGGVVHSLLGWYVLVQEVIDVHDRPAFGPLRDDARRHLANLVPPDALATVPWARLVHVPRYLAGIAKRFERFRSIGPERDTERMVQIHRWEHRLIARMTADAERGRDDPQVEAFRWLIEEYRMAQFAQELGTAEPASEARLERAWRDIEAAD